MSLENDILSTTNGFIIIIITIIYSFIYLVVFLRTVSVEIQLFIKVSFCKQPNQSWAGDNKN